MFSSLLLGDRESALHRLDFAGFHCLSSQVTHLLPTLALLIMKSGGLGWGARHSKSKPNGGGGEGSGDSGDNGSSGLTASPEGGLSSEDFTETSGSGPEIQCA